MRRSALPPLNALRAFEAVARHLSFKAAADDLSVTPAAVSQHIKGLEERLAQPLVIRGNRTIALTPAGRRLASGLTEGFDRLAEAVASIREPADARVIVVSAGPAVSAKWLAPRIWRFIERHPDLDVRLSANLGFADFTTDGVDIGIRFGRVRYDGLFGERLVDEAILPLANPATVAQANLRRPADLVRVALLHDGSTADIPGTPGWAEWLAAAGVTTIDPSQGLRFTQADHALDAVAAGAGVVMGRRTLAAGDLIAGRLVCPFGPMLPSGYAFHLVCRAGREAEPKIAAFRAWMAEEMAADAAALAPLCPPLCDTLPTP